ncbi:MAG: hypothetical protein H7A53_01470 [Akkermansiaceae bacterium]|nr:hypothetical protein [Akkermansiaceae bacterium]MCP5549556.1 hypothetical protein [Akkermansiaceae bacterium]
MKTHHHRGTHPSTHRPSGLATGGVFSVDIADGTVAAADPNGGIRLEEDDATTAWNLCYDTTNDNLAIGNTAFGTEAMVVGPANFVGIGIGTAPPLRNSRPPTSR